MSGPKPLFAGKPKTLQRVTNYPHAETNAILAIT